MVSCFRSGTSKWSPALLTQKRFATIGLAFLLSACSAAFSQDSKPLEQDANASGKYPVLIDTTGADWVTLGKNDFVKANCDDDTWVWDGNLVHCTGLPVGVLRSSKKYKNLEFVGTWRHLSEGGNSGFFLWTPEEALDKLPPNTLPNAGIEVQVLDHGYTAQFEKSSGKKADWFSTNGDIFPVGKSKLKPFAPLSPDGSRSFPKSNHSLGTPQWNHYYVRAINGEVRLWVNGHEVSGGTDASPAEGYLCLESEGAPVEFKDIKIRELPSGVIAQVNNPGSLISGVELQHFDSSVEPSEDFFRHVNGKWLSETPIPSDQSNYGSFTILDIETKAAIKKIIEEAGVDPNPSPIAKQVGDFYRSYTDLGRRNELGLKPIENQLQQILSIKDKSQLAVVAGKLSGQGIGSFLSFYIEPDARRSDQYAIYVNQDGISLPDRDYYLLDDEQKIKTRQAYVKFIEDMLTQIGWKDPSAFAAKILAMETAFAKSQWSQVELRDPVKGYNKMPSSEFGSKYSGLLWEKYAKSAGLPVGNDLIIGQPSFFESASSIIDSTDIETLKAYLAFQAIDSFAPLLTESLEKMHFDFHETTLSGVTEQEPLWRRGVDACNGLLGMPVGQLYVERFFSPKAKVKMNALVKNLLVAFENRIEKLEWMGNGTKAEAKQKLALFTPKIGYPDAWKDYSTVEIVEDNIVANLLKIAEFERTYQIGKLGKPINRNEWFMSPQTVNAYYNPTMNEIVFPAAILQPPFFNLEADDAVNYGAIGAVIGHEISHGFDDSGAQFDGKGNLRDWWTEKDKEEFKSRSAQLVSQYNDYAPLPNSKVNGSLTLGENIGDLGGMSVAYTAYQLSLGGNPAPVIDGYTGDQRFFIGWAQVWRRKYRDQEMLKRLMTDPHSPSQYRCNGIVSNLDQFYKAFPVSEGSKMFLPEENRVRIW